MTDLAKLRELLAESSQGEWVAVETGSEKYMAWIVIGTAKDRDTVALVDNRKIEIGTVDVDEANANANLICTLRNEAPALLDEVEKLRAALRGLYDQLDSLEDFKFSRDLSPSEAQMNFDDARWAARKALGETE